MRHPVNDLVSLMENEAEWKKQFELYLDDGGDVNHPNVFLSSPHLGKTLLIRALELNSFSVVKKLIDAKVNVNCPHAKTLQSPLSYLLSNPRLDQNSNSICKLLIDNGADVNKVDEFTYMSPLYHILSLNHPYNNNHALVARQLLAKDAISAFKSHPDYVIGEITSLDTPRTIILHQNPAFVFLANESQPLTQDYYAMFQFLIKKTREKTYVQLYNFFPTDKSARTLDKYAECTFFQHLVICNSRVYPFTPLTYLFTKHRKTLPPYELVSHLMDNSDARLHPDVDFLSKIGKFYKDILSDGKVLTHSRPNAPGNTGRDKANSVIAQAAQIAPDPRLIYQTYCDLGFNVLNDILSHPSSYNDNTLSLVRLLFECESFKTHYKRWVYYKDPYVSGYFDYKVVEHYKKTKISAPDAQSIHLLFDPSHEEKYSTTDRIVITEGEDWTGPEYISDIDSDKELFVTELKSDPFFLALNHMCQSYIYHPFRHSEKHFSNNGLLQHLLHHGCFHKNTLFFPNGVGEQLQIALRQEQEILMESLKSQTSTQGKGGKKDKKNGPEDDDDDDDHNIAVSANGLVHRPFDEYFAVLYELLLSNTVSLHLSKDQLDVGRELMAAQADDSDDEGSRRKSKKSDKKRDKALFSSDNKHATENHNYMYRASGTLLLAIRGRSQPNVDFIEYLIHNHHATTTISMYSFHNVFLWLLSSCHDLDLEKYRYLLSLLLDDAGCDVLSVKYQNRIHQLTQQPINGQQHVGHSTTYGGGPASLVLNEDSRIENSRTLSTSRPHSTHNYYDPHSQHNSIASMNTQSMTTPLSETSSKSSKSLSFISRITSIFNTGPGLVTKTLARQYSFDYFSLVLLYCLTSPRTTTYLYIFTLMTILHERLITHQSTTSMSLVLGRNAFINFNRDHIHSHMIEYSPLFNQDQSLLHDKKHVANTLILYFMAYGNLRLHGATEVYQFLIQHQPFKLSSYHLLMKCFLSLHSEQYYFEYKDKSDHHLSANIKQYHDQITQYKIARFGGSSKDEFNWEQISNATDRSTTTRGSHYDEEKEESEEEKFMLDLKINPRLLLSPRSPLLTEPGHLFIDLIIGEYWNREIQLLKQQYHYDEEASHDATSPKNQQFNEHFTFTITYLLTQLINNTIFSPQDGVWFYKIVDKLLTVTRSDISAHRREMNLKHQHNLSKNSDQQNQSDALNNQKLVNLDSNEHVIDLSLFTHTHQGVDYSYKVDCTRLFHTPIPVSSDIVRAITSLLAGHYHVILIYYQQYFTSNALSPFAYHIYHSVLEKPVGEELPTGLANDSGMNDLSSRHGRYLHNVVIVDDDENTQNTENTLAASTAGQQKDDAAHHEAAATQHAAKAKTQLVGAHYGRYSLATITQRDAAAIVKYDPADIRSTIQTTYASTIKQLERSRDCLENLRQKKVESFLRYRGALPAIYGLLRATSQQAVTATWFQLFDLLIASCKDIFMAAKLTRSSPLSIFLFSCLVFDANSLAVAKWLLQPPIGNTRDLHTKTIEAFVNGDSSPPPKLPKVSDCVHTQLCPPPPHQRLSITSQEYIQREIANTRTGENQHFDYVEALYALVTAPAHRHNQVYKSLLEKMLLFIYPDDLNLLSFDPNSVLTNVEFQQQQLTYQALYQQFNMNKSIVSQYLSHLSSPTQMSIDILHLLLRAGGKVHLANLTTNQSPLIYFVQQQTHQRNITREFFDIFKLLFQNYGHCGNLLLVQEHRTLFELALSHIRVIDDICVEYFLFLLSTSHVSYRHSLGYPDVMDQLAMLEQNKSKRLIAPVLSVDRADGLWSKTHKLIDSAWVEPTGHTLFKQFEEDNALAAAASGSSQIIKRSYKPSPLSREEFSTLFDFYYSALYLAPSSRHFSVVHALANHRDQHIVATLFGNVPNHDRFLYYNDQTRSTTLKEVIIAALTARKKELNNYMHFAINLAIVDCIENVEPIAVDEETSSPKLDKNGHKIGSLFCAQHLQSATPTTAPAIPEWATALSDTMHLNFSQKRQKRTVLDGTTGIFWYILNHVHDPATEDIITLLDGLKDEEGKVLSTPVSLEYQNSNNETPLMHAILRRWNQDILIFMINKITVAEALKQRDNNGRSASDYMVAVCTHLYAPEAFKMLHPARK